MTNSIEHAILNEIREILKKYNASLHLEYSREMIDNINYFIHIPQIIQNGEIVAESIDIDIDELL
jgi:predicted RNA-binding protein with EMAP domain